MTYRVEVTARADEDLRYAVNFIRLDSPSSAARWLDEFSELAASLAQFPERFAVLQTQFKSKQVFRTVPHYSHRVIYRVDHSTQTVFVLRVYHGARRPLRMKDIEPVL